MVTFDNEALFGAGTSRFKIGLVKLRHAVQQPPGSRGSRIDAQGTEARQITQTGVLIADNPASLEELTGAIRTKLDGLPHLLIDNLGRQWPDTVMTAFEAQESVRIGARWKTTYKVEYLQVIP